MTVTTFSELELDENLHNTGEQIALQTDEHYVSNVYNRRPTQR